MSRNAKWMLGTILLVLLGLCVWSAEGQVSAVESAKPNFATSLPDFGSIARANTEKLATVDSNQAALSLFVGTIGPAVDLQDAASTLGAKALPPKLSKDLLLPELTETVHRFVAALAAWDIALRARATAEEGSSSTLSGLQAVMTAREGWLPQKGSFTELSSLKKLAAELAAGTSDSREQPAGSRSPAELSTLANRLELEASRQAYAEWWQLKNWKDRVRAARGRAKLCGTWQWAVHNHQNHREQKTSMTFLPMGTDRPGVPKPAEIVVLGDSVYLRWEMDGRVQEDSLLFTGEGQRLEGSFVNSLGAWGSITGKRIGPCQQ